MKIQIENYGYKYTVETTHNDVNIDEYLQLFKGLLITAHLAKNNLITLLLKWQKK